MSIIKIVSAEIYLKLNDTHNSFKPETNWQ